MVEWGGCQVAFSPLPMVGMGTLHLYDQAGRNCWEILFACSEECLSIKQEAVGFIHTQQTAPGARCLTNTECGAAVTSLECGGGDPFTLRPSQAMKGQEWMT